MRTAAQSTVPFRAINLPSKQNLASKGSIQAHPLFFQPVRSRADTIREMPSPCTFDVFFVALFPAVPLKYRGRMTGSCESRVGAGVQYRRYSAGSRGVSSSLGSRHFSSVRGRNDELQLRSRRDELAFVEAGIRAKTRAGGSRRQPYFGATAMLKERSDGCRLCHIRMDFSSTRAMERFSTYY